MLSDYCNESITLKRPGTPNEYNESTFTSYTILANVQNGNTITINGMGVSTLSATTIFTETPVLPTDVILYENISWLVISINRIKDINNDVIGYEVKI